MYVTSRAGSNHYSHEGQCGYDGSLPMRNEAAWQPGSSLPPFENVAVAFVQPLFPAFEPYWEDRQDVHGRLQEAERGHVRH